MSDIQEHMRPGRGVCVIAFSSRPERFEWGGTLARLGVSHVLLRDSTERWYQGGVLGLGSGDVVVDCIASLRADHRSVIALGLSSGSHAALAFGIISAIDEVIAISPITGKGDALKPDFDEQWWKRIEHGPEHPPVPDLKPMYLQSHFRPVVRAFVSDGEGTELDRKMAERIGVTDITMIPGHSHAGLARHMRDAGIIAKLIGAAA